MFKGNSNSAERAKFIFPHLLLIFPSPHPPLRGPPSPKEKATGAGIFADGLHQRRRQGASDAGDWGNLFFPFSAYLPFSSSTASRSPFSKGEGKEERQIIYSARYG
jgi:hypothetical protein